MNEPFNSSALDRQLKQLAITAQQAPPRSCQRQRALNRMLALIQRSNKLVRPQRGQFQELYEEIYAEAVQRLFVHLCDKIDHYNPERGEVLQWANFLLSRQFFIEAIREVLPAVPKGLDYRQTKRLTLDDLDRRPSRELHSPSTSSVSQQLLQYLQEDPEGKFQQTHIDRHPEATFQFLAIQHLAGYTWKELSAELGIAIPTLSSFYQRCLIKFAPQLREQLS